MNYRWAIAPPQPLLAGKLAAQLQISPLLAQCLINRGFSEPATMASFLEPRLRQLSDPSLIPNLDAAVEALVRARERQEAVVLFGDYDVDGITATALLAQVLRRLGWQVHHYLPHRLEEGYGLSEDGVKNCLRQHPVAWLIAVDCGSTAVSVIRQLKEQGVGVIVLDHHQITDPPPPAVALVNPQLAPPGARDFRELCSVGLAFKLAHALIKRDRQNGLAAALETDLREWLDLVALGTVADLVPLRGENRILVSAGLSRLHATRRPGLIALKEVAQTDGQIGVYEVGFQLAPRLNAAGRLENAAQSLSLLLSQAMEEAQAMARALDLSNRERQRIEQNTFDEVAGLLRNKFNPESDYVIVEGGLYWHVGVVGIVAARVLRKYYRPTLILGGNGDEWKGSGRSIEGFDLAAALRQCDDLLIRHGGHAMAAGVSIEPGKIDLLRQRLNGLAQRALSRELLQPVIRAEAEIKLGALTLRLLKELEKLEPMGQGNPPVHLVVRGVFQQREAQRLGKESQHAKLWLTDGQSVQEAIWWNAPERLPQGRLDLAFVPEINQFNGRATPRLKIVDCRGCSTT